MKDEEIDLITHFEEMRKRCLLTSTQSTLHTASSRAGIRVSLPQLRRLTLLS